MTTFLKWLSDHKVSTHTIGVLVTGLLLYYRINSDFHALVTHAIAITPKWIITLLTAGAWLYAWYRNGQRPPTLTLMPGAGTKAMQQQSNNPSFFGTKQLAAALAITFVLAICSPAAAQAPTPTPTPAPTEEPNIGQHFDVTVGYERLLAGGNATVLSARLPVSPRWSFLYSQSQIPSASAQIYQAGGEFREKLSHFFKPKAALINLDAIQVHGSFGVGTKRDDLGNNPTFAYSVHGGADIGIGKIGGGTVVVGVTFGYIGIPGNKSGPRHFAFGDTPSFSPELSFRF